MSSIPLSLRKAVAAIERREAALSHDRAPRLGFGAPDIDEALDGGLAADALHDILAETPPDTLAAFGFALALASRRPGALLLVTERGTRRENGRLYGPGLAGFGLDPARLLLVEAPDIRGLLQAMEEGLGCRSLAAVLGLAEGAARAYDLTASRRLALAAARSGITALMLRAGAPETPTAAVTRWRIAAHPSLAPGFFGQGVGPPAVLARLVRRRDGPPLSFRLVWCADEHRFEACGHDDGTLAAPPRRRRGDGAAFSLDPPALPAGRAGVQDAPRRRGAA